MKKKVCQHESSVVIDNIDIDKIVVLSKIPFGKADFKYLMDYKIAKKMHVPFKNVCI